jgi:hypothetical protein
MSGDLLISLFLCLSRPNSSDAAPAYLPDTASQVLLYEEFRGKCSTPTPGDLGHFDQERVQQSNYIDCFTPAQGFTSCVVFT